jgi:putative tryptophan/tyrosine transport system substrate-binding protein
VNRRAFLALLGGAMAQPIFGHAQQADRLRRVGVLMFLAADDPEAAPRMAAFTEGLQRLGWIEGRDFQMHIRWGAGNVQRSRLYAEELVALAPDVILASASQATAALHEATRTIPVVFVNVTDPVGAGYVATLARPGGNATGFSFVEYGTSAKWLEFLKEIAPRVKRVAVLRDPTVPVGIGQLGAIQSAAPAFGVEVTPVDVRDEREIDRSVSTFARVTDGCLIVSASPLAIVHRELIIALAARHRLPAIYFQRVFVDGGGLLSYGPDPIDPYHRAAGYVDRILKGERPDALPVQAPTKYELVINLKTARALGLEMPQPLLARADEVIE